MPNPNPAVGTSTVKPFQNGRVSVGTDAAFSAIQAEWSLLVPAVLPYRPGELFLRELPPLRAVLAQVRDRGLLVMRAAAIEDVSVLWGAVYISTRHDLSATAHVLSFANPWHDREDLAP